MARTDGRACDELRPFSLERGFTNTAAGSVLVRAGDTVVLCTASVSEDTPPWMREEERGWLTAEYNMLPGSTRPRKSRDRLKVDGRTTEIQRLIGRSLRAVVDLRAIGARTITVDCDVLQADGGTRTASITGGFVAIADAVHAVLGDEAAERRPFLDYAAAVSCGVVGKDVLLDLCYEEDFAASVDANFIMTGAGKLIEVQATGEEATFDRAALNAMLSLAEQGVQRLVALQREALGDAAPRVRAAD